MSKPCCAAYQENLMSMFFSGVNYITNIKLFMSVIDNAFMFQDNSCKNKFGHIEFIT